MAEEGPRTRSRNVVHADTPVILTGKKYYGTQSDPYRFTPVTAHGVQVGLKHQETMDDVVTKNYKARSAAGEVINNPLRRILRTQSFSDPMIYHRDMRKIVKVGGVDTWRGDLWHGAWPMTLEFIGELLGVDSLPEVPSVSAKLKDMAVTNAWARASQAEVSALMIMGEGRKTVVSLAEIVGRAIKILLAIKRADLKYLANQLSPDEIADRYMEARYALRPLMYDAEGILKAWESTVPNLKMRSTARGFTAREWSKRDTIVFQHVSSGTTCTVDRSIDCSVAYRSGLLCDVDVTHLSVWGVDTVFETALELIPFSFIAGWFFNIANTLASWTPKAGVRALASWVTKTSVLVTSNKLVRITNTNPTGLMNPSMSWGGMYSSSVLDKHRETDLPRRVLPHWDVQLDTLKLLDLTKILSQIMS